jgi:hypothetical protein
MDRFGVEDESWFQAARAALSQRGFSLRLQPKSIVVEHPTRLPRIFTSSRELLEFAQKQGIPVGDAAFTVADLYGDGIVPPLTGRRTPSQFETPPELVGSHTQTEGARAAEDHLVEAERRMALEAELARQQARAEEAEKQCTLWQLSAAAAEDRANALQAALDSGGRGPDRRFEALRRFLARELHPDLAGGDLGARRVREEIFKRVWAKIEELQ